MSLDLKHCGLSRAEKRPMLLHARTPHDHGSVVDIIKLFFCVCIFFEHGAPLGRDGAQRRCRRARRNARQTVVRVDVLNNGRRLVLREITISAPGFLRGVVQRPCHTALTSHDIHEDGPGVVATVAEMTVGLQASPAIWPRATVRMGRRDVFKRVCSVFVI